MQIPHDLLVEYREQQFHPPVQIARHQIRAARIYFLIAVVAEIINAAVLQKAPHNASHGDVLAHPGQSRAQAAQAANDQFDFHARSRRFIKQPDRLFVFKRIGLENQMPALAQRRLAPDQIRQSVAHGQRSDQQPAEVGLVRISGQLIEQIRGVGPDLFVAP